MQIGFRFIFVKRSLKLNLSSRTIMMMIIYDDTIDLLQLGAPSLSKIRIENRNRTKKWNNKGRRDHLEKIFNGGGKKYGRSNDVRR